ncbi:placenta-specific protein 9 isoform X1 [Heterocephalus glaber]|uniref:Placenta-specific protein 9 isoform X1 n=1 Tax=Heterocephalus glaber TaxID=10181 RepID=A0AAX6QVH6_HETGA|nr:placenta-specific protein 9 isoform X1 [Heterocephalus glaber]
MNFLGVPGVGAGRGVPQGLWRGRARCSREARSRPGILAGPALVSCPPGQTPRSPHTMRPLLCALAGLALLRAAAEPLSASQGDPTWSTGCDRLEAVQGQLDVMEEVAATWAACPTLPCLPLQTAEKTVEHLETQVKSLLGLLEELAWNLPPGPFSPAPDLLGDGHF